ncbi:MAG: protoheme farnesyltransferase, partial [Microbacteriaceae bacterium]|nr:protoheme farnesyltransferase [Microbacteriaceae bacterium]
MDVAVRNRPTSGHIGFRRKFTAYLSLTKPRVVELLLVTTAPVMILAGDGLPGLWLVIATLIGGSLSAGSASAFNCYIDRDIDRLMKRTQSRPLVTGDLSDREALVFAWVIGVASIVWLAVFTNWLAASLSLVAILVYVFVYTLWLKRRTEQNIIWGGIAGCFPVLIGWAAVTGSLTWAP